MKSKKMLLAAILAAVTLGATATHDTSVPHFALRSSTPAADATVPSPEEIRLVFTQVPQENSIAVNLVDPAGDPVDVADPAYDDEDRTVIHVGVSDALPVGTYTVAWRGIGDDGHVVRGDFAFSVTADR